jgi:hypothetical protein
VSAGSHRTADGGAMLKLLLLAYPVVYGHVRHPFDAVTSDVLTGIPREKVTAVSFAARE